MNYYVILLIKDLARKLNICKTIIYKLIVIQTLKSKIYKSWSKLGGIKG